MEPSELQDTARQELEGLSAELDAGSELTKYWNDAQVEELEQATATLANASDALETVRTVRETLRGRGATQRKSRMSHGGVRKATDSSCNKTDKTTAVELRASPPVHHMWVARVLTKELGRSEARHSYSGIADPLPVGRPATASAQEMVWHTTTLWLTNGRPPAQARRPKRHAP